MRREDFVDFYSDFSDEDPEYIREYLDSEGVDAERLRVRLLEEIAKRQAQLGRGRSGKFAFSFSALREWGKWLGEFLSPHREPHGATAGLTKTGVTPPDADTSTPGAEQKHPADPNRDSPSESRRPSHRHH